MVKLTMQDLGSNVQAAADKRRLIQFGPRPPYLPGHRIVAGRRFSGISRISVQFLSDVLIDLDRHVVAPAVGKQGLLCEN